MMIFEIPWWFMKFHDDLWNSMMIYPVPTIVRTNMKMRHLSECTIYWNATIVRKYVHSLYYTFKSLDKKEGQSNVWRRKFTVLGFDVKILKGENFDVVSIAPLSLPHPPINPPSIACLLHTPRKSVLGDMHRM